MFRIFATFLVLFVNFSTSSTDNFSEFYSDAKIFETAIYAANSPVISTQISGVTLPHHLLAADLIADALAQISAQKYDQIVIISPDHFDRGDTVFSTTTKDFATIFGEVLVAKKSVEKLLVEPQISASNLFSHEHGVRVFLPFLRKYFPETPIVPVTIKISATLDELKSLAVALQKILTQDTLILQSTDFSHYLSLENAEIQDQKTLRALASSDENLIFALDESDNLDSRGAQFLQFSLQKNFFGASPTIFENRNSQFYSAEKVAETTSYLVQFWSTESLEFPHEKYFFAGDTFFGRGISQKFSDETLRAKMISAILEITRGAKMIVNLEGVVREKCSAPRNDYELCIPLDFALPIFRELNIVAVGLANNHRHDFGVAGLDEMQKLLVENSIDFFGADEIFELPEFHLAAFTDLDNFGIPKYQPIIQNSDLDILAESEKPLFVFVHWGSEFVTEPTTRERDLSIILQEKGAEVLIGAHSHRASELACDLTLCQIFSLGNFIFDQPWDYTSGSILEVDFFSNGNYFLKNHRIPNFYTKI
ncbi:AmmeMemoRadiSam system protein B [Candidatus Gracilibacteria bacterium]|nr:AmmeMemoRadiSam system protein B [Candidatus Gracilibacteria bacterium]MCF7856844.1 AmmeMemoRadiSam system protein B [Candidatus Gracilibacteria bacterium]MCF7896938.1 AmmeMemoRadiSam system protein B [Candidatus Gracilibacteria bacterium]